MQLITGSKASVGDAICAHAEALDAALVVVATHRKSKLEELIKGSVSLHVAARCAQPTLLYKRKVAVRA